MMDNKIQTESRRIVQNKNVVRAVLKKIVYTLLYWRLMLLVLRHKLVVKSSFKSTNNNIAHTTLSLRSLFQWEFTNYVATTRIYVVIAGFSLLFLIISTRLLLVATTDFSKHNKSAIGDSVHRLDITDRNNNLLAVSLPGSSLYANPKKVIDPEESVDKLVSVIPGLDKNKILADLKSGKNFVWIKRDLTPSEHEKIFNIGMPGFGFEREQKRIYTYGNLLSHVIGYVGRDLDGLAGVEQYFNKFLTSQQEAVDRSGMGSALQLSIDVRVQNILSEEMDKMMDKFKAKGAAGIIVDPNNGEILALVSKPDFDPHNPGSASHDQLFNVATQGVYELGSGMKGLTISVGLDSGATSIYDAYDLTYFKVKGKVIKDDYRPMKGWHSVPHIFLKSSNIGVGQIVLEIGKNTMQEYLRKLKLLEPLDIEVLERAKPLYPNFARWNDLSLVTMSYGYGLSVSPAHFVQAMIPIVNGGIMYPLTLIKRNPKEKLEGVRVFKEKTSLDMRKLWRLVVTDGSGSKAEVKGYYVGGKTGTAEVAENGKYAKNRRISSFFGVLPATNPKYIMYVVYREPVGIKETFGFAGGGWTGAPTVGAVFKRLISLYGINKLDEDSPEVKELNNIEYKIRDET